MLYLQADHTFFQKLGSDEASIEAITRHVQRANVIYKNTGEREAFLVLGMNLIKIPSMTSRELVLSLKRLLREVSLRHLVLNIKRSLRLVCVTNEASGGERGGNGNATSFEVLQVHH